MNTYKLELYITGNSARSSRAVRDIEKVCNEHLKDAYELKIYDVLETPEMAEKAKVIATPTLIKRIPPPVTRLIGDFSNFETVKNYLDI